MRAILLRARDGARKLKAALSVPQEPVRDAIHLYAQTLMDRQTRGSLLAVAIFSAVFTILLSLVAR